MLTWSDTHVPSNTSANPRAGVSVHTRLFGDKEELCRANGFEGGRAWTGDLLALRENFSTT